jgi:hypothetical protein
MAAPRYVRDLAQESRFETNAIDGLLDHGSSWVNDPQSLTKGLEPS